MSAFFRKLFRYSVVPIIWTLLIIFLLCIPGSSLPDDGIGVFIPHFDKYVHVGLFGGFVVCWAAFFRIKLPQSPFWTRYVLIATLLSIVLGIAMEFVQLYWIPDRSFDLYDIVADSAGAIVAALILLYVYPKR